MKKVLTSVSVIVFFCTVGFLGGLTFPRGFLSNPIQKGSRQSLPNGRSKPLQFGSGEAIFESIMNYPMKPMVERCQKTHGYTDEDMLLIERELKRYFIMAVKSDFLKSGSTGMYSSHVDNLWHCFILFTKEYNQFCLTTAGYFIHHVPETGTNSSTPEEKCRALRNFINNYEQTFKEPINPIWLIDQIKT